METPKEKAIKAAYGEHWDKVKDVVEESGWVELYRYNFYTGNIYTDLRKEMPFLLEEGYEIKYFNNGNTHYVRPKSLSGIETNNSWTRIESEEDLPKEKGYHDSDNNMPISVENAEKLFQKLPYDGIEKSMIPNNKETWSLLGVKMTKNGLIKVKDNGK